MQKANKTINTKVGLDLYVPMSEQVFMSKFYGASVAKWLDHSPVTSKVASLNPSGVFPM